LKKLCVWKMTLKFP